MTLPVADIVPDAVTESVAIPCDVNTTVLETPLILTVIFPLVSAASIALVPLLSLLVSDAVTPVNKLPLPMK